jgi:hypothetical protein
MSFIPTPILLLYFLLLLKNIKRCHFIIKIFIEYIPIKNTNSKDKRIGVGINNLLDISPIYATILSDFNPLEKVYFLKNSFSVLKKQRIKYL